MNNKFNNDGVVRLLLMVLFSFAFLSIWNTLFLPKNISEVKSPNSNNIIESDLRENDRGSLDLREKKDFSLSGKDFSLSGAIDSDGKIKLSRVTAKAFKDIELFNKKDELVFGFNKSSGLDKFETSIQEIKNDELIIISKNKDIEISRKILIIDDRGIEIQSLFKNKSKSDIEALPYVYFLSDMVGFDEAVSGFSDKVSRFSGSDFKKETIDKNPEWIGLHSKYFSLVVDSKDYLKLINTPANFEKNRYRFGEISSVKKISSSSDFLKVDRFFIIPNQKDIIKGYSSKYSMLNLEKITNFGTFFFIVEPILFIMDYIYKIFPNYAFVIILITVLFKLLTIPLLNRSYVGMSKIKTLNPEIDAIKEKFKDDKILMQKEIMNLYKINNVNPLSSMIPMLIQLPFFFAFYKVFSVAFQLHGAHGFLWISDLSDTEGNLLFKNLPYVPNILRIGPMALLMGLTSWLQQKTTPMSSGSQDSSHAFAMKFMPIFFIFISSSFPSGLLIYWIISNTFSIIHQLFYSKVINDKIS